MRLYPPAWGLARVAIEDHELGGYPVRKGMGVAMAQWVVQRDTRWYDKPEEFRPERWEGDFAKRSEEHTSELQSRLHLVCRLLLEKKKKTQKKCNRAANTTQTPVYEDVSNRQRCEIWQR